MKIIPLLVLLYAFTSNASLFGGVDGGGADHLSPDFGSAWFLQEHNEKRIIKYCILKDETTFPVHDDKIKGAIEKAFSTWDKYISENGVETDPAPDQINLKMVKRIQLVDTCTKKTDLVFYLGTTNKIIDKVKKVMNKPAALAYRTNYDRKKGWSRGFVWVNHEYRTFVSSIFPWDKNLNLEGVLLHEIGHIFGVEHHNGTIMSDDFTENFYAHPLDLNDELSKYYVKSMTQIDQEIYLYKGDVFAKFGGSKGTMWIPGSKTESLSFELLFGRKPNGNVTTSYHPSTIIDHSSKAKNFLDYNFIVKEGSQETVLKGVFNMKEFSTIVSNTKIFYRIKEQKIDKVTTTETEGIGVFTVNNIVGTITSLTGKTYSVVIESNLSPPLHLSPIGEPEGWYTNTKPVSIYILHEGRKYPIFGGFKKWDYPEKTKSRQKAVNTFLKK